MAAVRRVGGTGLASDPDWSVTISFCAGSSTPYRGLSVTGCSPIALRYASPPTLPATICWSAMS